MKKLTVLALLFLLVGLSSSCSKEKEKTTNSAVVTGDEVFQKSCISCHSSGDISGGQVKLDDTKIHNDFKKKEDLSKFVQTNMPKSAPGTLSKKEYEAVVKYLWDQKQ
jgi:mono/diheme cytochrome c family protein